MFDSYEFGDLRLEDLVYHCSTDLIPGSIIYYDGHVWRLKTLDDIQQYTAGEGIIISSEGEISVDPNYFDASNYYTKIEIDEKLEGLDPASITQIKNDITQIKNDINTINNKITSIEVDIENIKNDIEELKDNDTEEVRFVNVTMDGDTETVFSHTFITNTTDALLTWISGEPNGIVETYVENGKLTIRSSENENGTVRVRLSKPKSNAFLS